MRQKRLVTGVVLLGIGLGGFFDGIVLHQILQWHHILSEVESPTTVSGIQLNVLADGLFHVATYITTVAGVALVWNAARGMRGTWSWLVLLGGVLIGWGAFNLVEGTINHHILQIHHVRPGPNQLAWGLGFLALGAVMLGVGVPLLQGGLRRIRAREIAGSRDEVDSRRVVTCPTERY